MTLTNEYLDNIVDSWHTDRPGMDLTTWIYIATGWTDEQIEEWLRTAAIV